MGFPERPRYRVDIPALHTAHPEVRWTRFTDWAHDTWQATAP